MKIPSIRGHGHVHPQRRRSLAGLSNARAASQLQARAMGNGADGAMVMPRTNDTSEKPVGNSTTVPIVLGICIPLLIAVGVLFYIHRRTAAREKREDETDKYKSMDFGLGDAPVKPKRRSLFGKEKEGGHTKGQLSMDMNLSSPYLLPPSLQQSRESLNSLAKTLHQAEDPYRPVANYGSEVGSLRSFQKGGNRTSSVYTGRTRPSVDRDSKSRPAVVTELPHRQRSLPPSPLQEPPVAAQPQHRDQTIDEVPAPPAKNEFRFVDDGPGVTQVPEIQEPAPIASQGPRRVIQESPRPLSNESMKAEHAHISGLVNERDSVPSGQRESQSTVDGLGIMASSSDMNSVPASLRPPQKVTTPPAEQNAMRDYQDFAHQLQIDVPASNQYMDAGDELHMSTPEENEYPHSAGLGVPQQQNKRLSVGLRPLPPDDFLESEDPEFRANRIRSFYKEYFEESKTDNGVPPPIPQQAQYYEDYDAGYGEAAYFDPETNAFVMPYAEPVTRRAMTPPPTNRRPMPGPRQRGPGGPQGPGGPHGRPRAGSTMSGGRFGPRSPRPGSSSSNPRPGGKPKKPLPPPSSLSTLPTPSKLRDDSFALLGSIEFAPPPTFKDQAAGRSQSPIGERRPYQLNTPIHSPLVSAFDETAALPSPHLLRKSGTFTALDFAPPRRFKDADSMSETGSIRSNRSGISTANLSAIRGGAGRVSRLPGDQVFTQASMSDQLKPQWGIRP
ncbi:hypothetical protein F5Y15DRAFT_182844 [Xylariaceae sp. FL0016]|nr:hypothetical protein F5Y15DRAFT_182844 [Xylariaceae sp. FL0016]